MTSTSNFRDAIKQAQGRSLLGPKVIANALPYVGGGLLLTAGGVYGGLGMMETHPELMMPTFVGALIAEIALFFVAQWVVGQGNNALALPLLALYSLLSGYTLSGLIARAIGVGVGLNGIMFAAIGCGLAFVVASRIASGLKESDGMALAQTVQIGMVGLLLTMVAQIGASLLGWPTPGYLEIAISAVGVLLFSGCAVVDFYTLPRAYRDDQYLSVALSMYLTYINLFVFVLRLIIAITNSNRD
jgi:uncharacterized protein